MLSSSVRRGKDTAAFISGLSIGAVLTALALMMLGSILRWPIPEQTRIAVVVAVGSVLVLRELGLLSFPVPQNARLVPQYVTLVPFWGPLQFGAEMGTGMRTYSPTGLPHAVVLMIVFLGDPLQAALAGVGFALGRAVMVLSFVLSRDFDAADRAFHIGLGHVGWLLAVAFAACALLLLEIPVVDAVRFSVAGLLGAAAIAKMARWRVFTAQLRAGRWSPVLAGAFVVIELVIAVAGLAVPWLGDAHDVERVGLAYLAVGVTFLAAQLYWLLGPKTGCPCFGESTPQRASVGFARAGIVVVGGAALAWPLLATLG